MQLKNKLKSVVKRLSRIFIKRTKADGKGKKAELEEDADFESSAEQTDTLLFLSPTE